MPRMTVQKLMVLRALLDGATYGLEVTKATGLRSGTVYPVLAGLEDFGWLASTWEDACARGRARPLRRYYSLTPAGADGARAALSAAHARLAAVDEFFDHPETGARRTRPAQRHSKGRPPSGQ